MLLFFWIFFSSNSTTYKNGVLKGGKTIAKRKKGKETFWGAKEKKLGCSLDAR